MRRRPNADAPIAADSSDLEVASTEVRPSPPEISEAAVAPGDTPARNADPLISGDADAPKISRRRGVSRRKTADDSAPTDDVPTAPAAEASAYGAVAVPPPAAAMDASAAVGNPASPVDAGNPDAPSEPAQKRAPRRRRATAAETPVAETAAAVTADTDDPATAAPDAPANPPRRRGARRTAADAPPVADTPPVADSLPVNREEAATTPAAPAEALSEDPAREPRRRSRGGRRRSADPTPEPGADAPVAEAPNADASTTEGAPVEEPRRRSRGGRRRSGGDSSTDLSAGPVADAPPTEAAPGEEPRNRRGRGGRRRGSGEATETVAADAADTNGQSAPARSAGEPGEGEAAGAEPRRLRGPRRVPAAVVPATPSEPLPPQYQPLPDDVLARLPETRIQVRKNVPDLVVNGESRLPLWFFVNTEEALFGDDAAARDIAQREIRLAYEAGIRTFTILAHLPWRARSGERRYAPLDDTLQFVADNAPDALILPRLILSPPASWERAHADQMTRYADGERGDVSLASRAFWEGEADEAIRAAVEHIAQGPHAGRVFGFYLEHGEWLYEKGRGYDVSDANALGFRTWLRARYRNSQVLLRTAWYDGGVTFDTAAIPDAAAKDSTSGAQLFYTDREQRYVDFHEYSSDIVAQVITKLGKAVKEASGGRSAVATSYGYTLELSRAYSGHLALAQVLASPNIDILTGPVSYSGRTPGGSAPIPAPIDSIALAGKLWISEDDTKTFLAVTDTPDTYNSKVATFEGTWAAYTRNFGAALTRGAGISWMDLWGTGWLDDRDLWQRIGRLRDIADALATRRRNPRTRPAPEPDVAVIVDERSYFDIRADESVLGNLIVQQRDSLLRSGARIGFYLLSDLLKKNFPEGPRLIVFLNAFRLPDTLRTVIRERFQNNGRTLAWIYGPGCRETNLGELTEVIGMQLRIQPYGSKMGTQILSNARSPLTDILRGQHIGDETRVNPSFYVADPKATQLGEYTANGNTSVAFRKHARWQSVFIGEMALPIPLLRGLYQLAGVPVYTVDDDVANIGDNLLSLHSAPGGGTTVYLPEEAVLYDLLTEETLASDGRGARLSMPPRGSRLLFWGSAAEITRLGGDPKAGPPGVTESELPTLYPPFVFESGDNRAGGDERSASDISPEDDALMQAALAGEMPDVSEESGEFEEEAPDLSASPSATTAPELTPVGDLTEADEAAKKKRRRRRRGRGRGAADDDASGDLPDDDGEDETGAGDASENLVGRRAEDDDNSVVPAADEARTPPTPRGRPSLEELLPHSEVVDGTDFPPIPDELLPLESAGLANDMPVGVFAERGGGIVRRRRRGGTRGTGATTVNPDDVAAATEGVPTDPDHAGSAPQGE